MISIIIPTFNRATFIERAVKSVINQSYQDFEIIIIDDCSQDNTDFVIEKLKTKYSQYKIKYFKNNQNKGAQYTRNRGIKNAKGEWIAFLDSDDEFLPERIEKALKKAKEKNVQIVHCECIVDYGNNVPVEKRGIRKLSGNIYHALLESSGPAFPGLFVKKICFEKINFLDESIVAHQEWETSIRLAKYFEFGFIDEPLFIWHRGHEAISKDKKRNIVGHCQIIEKHANDIIKHLGKPFLQRHYLTLAYKSYDQKDYMQAKLFFEKALFLTDKRRSFFIKLQSSICFMTILNPRILDIKVIKRKTKKCLYGIIFSKQTGIKL